jgi:hypothetical protein
MIIVPQCSWFLSLGGLRWGSPKSFNSEKDDMEIDDQISLKNLKDPL